MNSRDRSELRSTRSMVGCRCRDTQFDFNHQSFESQLSKPVRVVDAHISGQLENACTICYNLLDNKCGLNIANIILQRRKLSKRESFQAITSPFRQALRKSLNNKGACHIWVLCGNATESQSAT